MTDRLDAQALWRDFNAICDFGGRLCGTDSEARAMDWLRRRGAEATGASLREIAAPYGGWRPRAAKLMLETGEALPCHPLVRSVGTPPEGLTAEVVDLGRGTPEEFEAHAGDLRGRIALVRHEAMFAAGTIHRRRKYDMARAAGAVGFLIAGPNPGDVVAGSSGRDGPDGVPALGVSPEGAARLARRPEGWARATMRLDVEEAPASTSTLLFDMPGAGPGWVVLSAHVDGHDLAESAIDNATGLAAALAIAAALAPRVSRMKRGLRLAFFSVEEWALTGSAQHVEAMTPQERASIAMNVNLDSVGGGSRLAALTSGFAGMEPFLLRAAASSGHGLRCVRPLMMNSDHGNFARAGIPAFRLVAGYDDPTANVRHVLTSSDTRDKVARSELLSAAQLALAITDAALNAPDSEAATWRK